MSYTIVTDVFCELCGNWMNGATGNKPERGKANVAARKAGWLVQRECGSGPWQHICPDCRKNHPHHERKATMTLNRHATSEGRYQPRPGTANNLPGATSAKPQWKTHVMAMAKLIVFLFAEERAGAESNLVDDRRWASLGINGATLLAKVRELLPCFDEEWTRQGRPEGDAEKRKALFNRLFYMFTKRDERGEGRSTYSSEHPRISLRLSPHLAYAQDVYRANKPVTREQVETSFRERLRAK